MLQNQPLSDPIATSVFELSPESTANVSSDNGGKTVRWSFPVSIAHWLPSQSGISATFKAKGRGAVQPCPSAGIHSLWESVRVTDFSGSTTLSHLIGYGSLAAQLWSFTSSETNDNQRALFEGQNKGESIDNDLFWKNSQVWYGGGGVEGANEANDVQVYFRPHTYLLNTEDFVSLVPLNGIRVEMVLADYRKSLRYLTGSLGEGYLNGLKPLGNLMIGNEDTPNPGDWTGADTTATNPELNLVHSHVAGTAYALPADKFRTFTVTAPAGGCAGVIEILETTGAGGTAAGAIAKFKFWGVDSAPGVWLREADTMLIQNSSTAGTAQQFKVNALSYAAPNKYPILPIGMGRKINSLAQYFTIPLMGPVGGAMAASPAGFYGNNTIKDPLRYVGKHNADYGSVYPSNVCPFEVGDTLYLSHTDGSDERKLGLLVKIHKSATDEILLDICPDVPLSVPGAADHAVLTTNYLQGETSIYFKNIDRERGVNYSPANIPVDYAVALAASSETVGYTLKDLTWQVKRAHFDPSIAESELKAAMSPSGWTMEFPDITVGLNNLQPVQGNSTLNINVPALHKARSIITVPTDSAETSDLSKDSLEGRSDDMIEYAYGIGSEQAPRRPVLVGRYSLQNPLIECQAASESIKAVQSFQEFPQNVTGTLQNYSIARQFARADQWFDLAAAGSLVGKLRYGLETKLQKFVLSYISHLKTIIVDPRGTHVIN